MVTEVFRGRFRYESQKSRYDFCGIRPKDRLRNAEEERQWSGKRLGVLIRNILKPAFDVKLLRRL